MLIVVFVFSNIFHYNVPELAKLYSRLNKILCIVLSILGTEYWLSWLPETWMCGFEGTGCQGHGCAVSRTQAAQIIDARFLGDRLLECRVSFVRDAESLIKGLFCTV
jgi:hypothetical protein